nr:sarcosine oxidase subunit gamma family protein [Lentibacter algarum]
MKAKSACEGLLPIEIGGVKLSEVAPAEMTLIAPYRGKEAALAKAFGGRWPAAGETASVEGGVLVWFGRAQAMLIGTAAPTTLAKFAAVTEQSDAWARVLLEGAGARDVLARLTPLDIRDTAFAVGQTARTELFHMQVSITRVSKDAWQIIGFRSMAGTLVHDLQRAMKGVAARAI